MIIINVQTPTEFDLDVKFPFYRSRLIGEYNFSGFEKTYWKFDSLHKVTVITERMSETTILSYDDERFNFFQEMVTKDMLFANGDYENCPEKFFNACVDRLVSKLAKAI